MVLYHFLIWNHSDLTGGGPFADHWDVVSGVLGRIRMPVLLALSGMLAARGLSLGWKSGTGLRSAVANYYLYVVWLTVYMLFYAVVGSAELLHSVDGWGDWASQLLRPETTLWYLFALAAFALVVTAMKAWAVPAWAAYALGAAAWLVGTFAAVDTASGKLLRNFVFFVIGVYATTLIRKAATLSWGWAAGLLVAFVALAHVGLAQGNAIGFHLLYLAAGLVAIPMLVTVVAQLCRIPGVGRVGSFVGARTLSIYVLHIPLIGVLAAVLPEIPAVVSLASTKVGDLVIPPLATLAVIAASLVVFEVLKRIPGNPLFAAPGVLIRRLPSSAPPEKVR